MKRIVALAACACLWCCLVLPAQEAHAVCAQVSMQISQELTLERVAFDARLVITNNLPDKGLQDIRVDVVIKEPNGSVKNEIFFSKITSLSNISAVNGTGAVAPGAKAEIHWLLIPSPGAGGTTAIGLEYFVGATLTYMIDGKQETVPINPDKITVKPTAQLTIDYFMPARVLGDNPYTPQVEPSIPFPLAVRVLNVGYGPATNLKIDSAQPQITSNKQGLLVDFKLLEAAVNDALVQPALALNLGTVESSKAATGYWSMLSTLTGTFSKFDVSFSHSSELGGELTSIIKEVNAHYLLRRIKVNLPGRDNRLDFLVYSADTSSNPTRLPEIIFESEIPAGSGTRDAAQSPVTSLAPLYLPERPTPQSPAVVLELPVGAAGWVYTRVPDPSLGLLKLLDVVRSDGVRLDPQNFWVEEGWDGGQQKIYTLQFVDYRADAAVPGSYQLVYTQPAEDVIPPSTKPVFDGSATGADPVYYVTPSTRILLVAADNDGGSGVDRMFRKIEGTDADFGPALPFSISQPGAATLRYYSMDRAGNIEPAKTATIVVDDAAPVIQSFQAAPSIITPLAPKGLVADRTTSFAIKVTDEQATLQGTIELAKGRTFDAATVVRTLKTTLASGVPSSVSWDGRDASGSPAPTGPYTARLTVTDGLDSGAADAAVHTAASSLIVTVADWFTGQPLDPNASASQQHPKISGSVAVWQDKRSGFWQIYRKDTSGGDVVAVTSGGSDHQHPAISGNVIVWQDNRNGNWDIYGYDLSRQQEFLICGDAGNQERPAVSGSWVAWQDDRSGNRDIYAYDLAAGLQVQVTSHVRDQMQPVIADGILAWEDYRHGPGEIYSYDLAEGTETRRTVDINDQALPASSGGAFVWTDQRNDQRDIYYSPAQNDEVRVTYGSGDHSQATMLGKVIVYTDYEAGSNDPNLAFYDIRSGLGALLTTNPARQEEPALGTDVLVWQDDRDGVSQIYWAPFRVEAGPLAREMKAGLNLIAVGDKLAQAYPSTSALIAARPGGLPIEKIVAYENPGDRYLDTSAGTDIALQKGLAIGLYARGGGDLEIAESGESALYTLLPGRNYVGMLTMPNGYHAYALLRSLGLDNVQSVRRFDSPTGRWESAAVRDGAGVKSPAGADFMLRPGDGLIIEMRNRVDGWKP